MLIRSICFGLVVVCLVVTGTAQQPPINTGDVDCTGSVDVGDITGLVAYLFQGGAEPCDFVSPGIAYKVDAMTTTIPPAPDPSNWWLNLYTLDSISIGIPAGGTIVLSTTLDIYDPGTCGSATRLGWSLDGLSDPPESDQVQLGASANTGCGSGYRWTANCDRFIAADSAGTYTAYLKIRARFNQTAVYRRTLTATYFPVNYGQ
ncbi:MAG: hypothetical protein ABII79_13165 [bacterium]